MGKITVLGIFGSPRKNGNTAKLVATSYYYRYIRILCYTINGVFAELQAATSIKANTKTTINNSLPINVLFD